jgi:NADP-dependent alcohol dehydrogenase
MNNFIFQNPTRLIFGKGMIAQLATEIPADKNIMVTFGSGSVKTNGIYEQVSKALEGKNVTEFWGIESNPQIETLRKAVELGKEKEIDFLLAVGGGSVIDGTKLIAAGLLHDGDPWDLVIEGKATKTIPLATVLTLPATGSEMNCGAVISNGETKEKYAFYSEYPVFSILDPETTFSLPPYQIACGIADTFVHVMEQYLTSANESRMMDRWAEGILMLLTTIAPIIKKNIEDDVKDYDTMSEFMLSATMGLNGFISMGVPQDWGTHMIGHELTALTGMTHGATLAIVLPGLLRTLIDQKREKLIQYGERIWGITSGLPETKALKAIEKTEEFFRSLDLNTRLTEVEINDDVITEIERRFNERNAAFGERQNITGRVARDILLNCK